MIAFLADENLKRKIISGLLRRNPSVDVVREQAVDELLMIAECSEPEEWADLVAYLPL